MYSNIHLNNNTSNNNNQYLCKYKTCGNKDNKIDRRIKKNYNRELSFGYDFLGLLTVHGVPVLSPQVRVHTKKAYARYKRAQAWQEAIRNHNVTIQKTCATSARPATCNVLSSSGDDSSGGDDGGGGDGDPDPAPARPLVILSSCPISFLSCGRWAA